MFWVGFFSCWAALSVFMIAGESFDWSDDDWFDYIYCAPVAIPIIIFGGFGMIVYKMFRSLFKGVESKVFKEIKQVCPNDYYHLFGNIWFCHDHKTKAIANKFFFFRIKR